MPTEIIFRAAGLADAEAIVAMQSLPGVRFGTLRLPHPSPEDVRKWLASQTDNDRDLLAWCGAELVGMGGLRRAFGRRGHVGMIGMAVHDAWVGQGIGRQILAALIDRAENWLGLTRLELTVYADNTAAIGLYRKFGFAVEGTHVGYAMRDGALVDALAMARHRGLAMARLGG